jgi:hypothetical protein
MVLETKCPCCQQRFDIDYFEMCFIYGGAYFWSHRCPQCESRLGLRYRYEIPLMVLCLLMAVALACGLFPSFKWAAAIAALVFCYLISGFLRFFCIKFDGLA